MQIDEFTELLDRYGSRSEDWPTSQRDAMRALLSASNAAREALHAAQQLDVALDAYVMQSPDLTERIMARLPRSRLQEVLDWLLPSMPSLWWRPAFAAAMPLLLGIAVGATVDVAGVDAVNSDWDAQEQIVLDSQIGLIAALNAGEGDE
ncbi:MAG: hypothetical protein V2I82_13045 [Halieaceae bacterium]|jgi:hypothetical protein|nr:hypothetical protein [Halieaceae bacterium]